MGILGKIAAGLSYTTVRQVKVHSVLVGAIYLGICIAIVIYVVGFEFFLGHGYQDSEVVKGTVYTKVKGTAYSQCGMGLKDCVDGIRVWDTNDLVSKDSTSVMVTTAIENTVQRQGKCPGEHKDAHEGLNEDCTDKPDDTCEDMRSSWSGIQNGTCLPADEAGKRWCAIRGWCPGEPDVDPLLIEGVDQWGLFIKLEASFPKFGARWDNANGTALQDGWNVFPIQWILDKSNVTYDNTTREKGVDLLMTFTLDCNLDKSERCEPVITVERTDTESTLSVGYNERSTIFFTDIDTTTGQADGLARELWKRYGVKVRILLAGGARRFDPIVALYRLGAGLALLGVATVVADLLILYVLPKKKLYYGAKYEDIYVNDGLPGFGNGANAHNAMQSATGYEDEFDRPLLGGNER